jgi:TusA-related sulfurtransferase
LFLRFPVCANSKEIKQAANGAMLCALIDEDQAQHEEAIKKFQLNLQSKIQEKYD